MPPVRPRVLVTRARHQASELAEHLRALGAEPILVPTLETVDPASFAALDAAIAELDRFHWLISTSANAVEALAARLQIPQIQAPSANPTPPPSETHTPAPPEIHTSALPENRVPHPLTGSSSKGGVLPSPPRGATQPLLPPHLKIAAIGPSTARALEQIGRTPGLVPPHAVAESLTEALLPYARQPDGTPTRFLLVRAEEARELLPETLRAAGAVVTIAPAYRTIVPEGSVELIRELFSAVPGAASSSTIDAVTFTSSSSARNLLALAEAAGVTLPPAALRISIGPITSQTLRDLGVPPHAEAPQATIASLAETVLNEWQARSR